MRAAALTQLPLLLLAATVAAAPPSLDGYGALDSARAHPRNLVGVPARRHTAPVRAVAFSPDGRWLASADGAGVVKLWDRGARAEARGFQVAGGAEVLAFARDSRTLATGGSDGWLRTWDVESGRAVAAVAAHSGAVRFAAWAGAALVSGGVDGRVRIFTAGLGEPRDLPARLGPAAAMALSPDGRRVALEDGGGELRLMALDGGGAEARGPGDHVRSLALSDGGALLIGAGAPPRLRTAGAKQPPAFRTLFGHVQNSYAVAFSPDGALALSLDDGSGDPRLWEVASGLQIRRFIGHCARPSALAFSPDGRHAASGDDGGLVLEWDVASGAPAAGADHPSCAVTTLAASAGGELLTASAGEPVRLWDARGNPAGALDPDHAVRGAVAVSPDGGLVFTVESDQGMVWDRARRWPVVRLQAAALISGAGFVDGERLVTAQPGALTLWNARAGAVAREVRLTGITIHCGASCSETHWPEATALAVAPTRRLVVAATEVSAPGVAPRAELWLWSVDQAAPVAIALPARAAALALSPDGARALVTVAGHRLLLVDLVARRLVGELPRPPADALALALSSNGLAATADDDGVVRLWDLARRRLVDAVDFKLVGDAPSALSFAPDGRLLVGTRRAVVVGFVIPPLSGAKSE